MKMVKMLALLVVAALLVAACGPAAAPSTAPVSETSRNLDSYRSRGFSGRAALMIAE